MVKDLTPGYPSSGTNLELSENVGSDKSLAAVTSAGGRKPNFLSSF